jgi:hypothetical protein
MAGRVRVVQLDGLVGGLEGLGWTAEAQQGRGQQQVSSSGAGAGPANQTLHDGQRLLETPEQAQARPPHELDVERWSTVGDDGIKEHERGLVGILTEQARRFGLDVVGDVVRRSVAVLVVGKVEQTPPRVEIPRVESEQRVAEEGAGACGSRSRARSNAARASDVRPSPRSTLPFST